MQRGAARADGGAARFTVTLVTRSETARLAVSGTAPAESPVLT